MTENSTPEAPPVRVPNVSAGAKSGLDHEVIGANAQEAYDVNQALAAEDASPDTEPVTVPAGTTEERLAWVSEADDQDDRVARADAIYQHGVDSGSSDAELAEVAAGLRAAVYKDREGQDPSATGDVPPGNETPVPVPEPMVIPEDVPDTVPGLLGWVHEAEGHDVQTDRAHFVLDREAEKPEDQRRSTLVDPLTDEYPRPSAD
jgi:hypothetical protein